MNPEDQKFMLKMLSDMRELVLADNLKDLDAFCTALHGRVCHCRDRQIPKGVEQ